MPFLISKFFDFFLIPCRVLPVWVGKSECDRNFGQCRGLIHFTCEIALNDEFFSQFSLDHRVLEQLVEILIKFDMFDCIGAILIYLYGVSFNLGPFWVRILKKILCLDQINVGCWFEHLKILDWRYDKDYYCRSIIHVEFAIRNQPFHR